MESKKTSRKLSSIFWFVLYSMPLLVLLITYIGYLNMYKENANVPNYEIETIEKGIFPTSIPNEGTINKFYINKSLSNEEIENLVFNSDIYLYQDFDNDFATEYCNVYAYTFCHGKFITDGVSDSNSLYHSLTFNIILFDYHTFNQTIFDYFGLGVGKHFIILFEDNNSLFEAYFSNSAITNMYNTLYVTNFISGWQSEYENFNLTYDYELVGQEYENYYSLNDYFKNLLSITPYIESEKIVTINGSLYDLTLKHTYDTFNDKFIWQTFNDVFNGFMGAIGFNINGYLGNFIMLCFVWFIQTLFIKIFIDLLTFIPAVYKKLMERWL